MKLQLDGAFGFYKSKNRPAVFTVFGIVVACFAFTNGTEFYSPFLILSALSAAFLGLGFIGLVDKRPYVTISKDRVEILGMPALAAADIRRITVESYAEIAYISRGAPIAGLIEYVAFYVNDLSVFNKHFTIGNNKPGTPFYVNTGKMSLEESRLFKEKLKDVFGGKADLRSVIY
ncbi:MAG: hypothetical protein FWF35_02530 [Elusimicrobia bacterium]|nr:hypothetical protein [Elusimicrobiota bacterium]